MEQYAGIDVSLGKRERVRCRRDWPDRARGQGGQRARGADRLVLRGLELALARIGLEAGPLSQWLYAGMREAGLAGRAARDPACPGCVQGDAGQDRSQGRARHRAADAAGLVSSGALQVVPAQETACAADGAQAAAEQAPRRGDEPARGAARLRAEGRADDAAELRGRDPRTGRRPCDAVDDGRGAACGTRDARGKCASLEKRLARSRLARTSARGC